MGVRRVFAAQRNDPGCAPLPACSCGERRIDRNQAQQKSPCLRRVIIVCNPTHLARSALRTSNGSSIHYCTLEAMRTQGAHKTLADTHRGFSQDLLSLTRCLKPVASSYRRALSGKAPTSVI